MKYMYSFTKHRIHILINTDKHCWKIATGNNRVYLHVTFGGMFTIQQGLISCPLHGNTALKISNISETAQRFLVATSPRHWFLKLYSYMYS